MINYLEKVFGEAYRVLKEGGVFVIVHTNGVNAIMKAGFDKEIEVSHYYGGLCDLYKTEK